MDAAKAVKGKLMATTTILDDPAVHGYGPKRIPRLCCSNLRGADQSRRAVAVGGSSSLCKPSYHGHIG